MTVILLFKKSFQVVAKKYGVFMLVVHEVMFISPPWVSIFKSPVRFSIIGMVIEVLVFEKIFQECPRLPFSSIKRAIVFKVAKNAAVVAREFTCFGVRAVELQVGCG